MSLALLFAFFVAVAVGGLGFAVTSGDSTAVKRRQALTKSARQTALDPAAERALKKKQIAESVSELDKRRKGKRVDLQIRIEQAGLPLKKEVFRSIFLALGLVVGVVVYVKVQMALVAALLALTVAFGVPNLLLARLRKRRIKKFIDVFPDALDIMTRGIRAGLPVNDTLRIIATEAQEPVRSEFRTVVEQQSLGISVPDALQKLAQRVPSTETNFFAIVLEIQSKAGGNLSEAVGNLSKTVRDRKRMRAKIGAMSMEALASAVIIGLVPFVVTGALYVSSPGYISLLFTTNHGRIIAIIAVFWMAVGAAAMKKMINFDF